MNTKKVSIIIPCYNQAQYLPEALQSVLEQTYSDWECIVVNDGSTDHTEEVVQEWIAKDSRFKYVYKENGGLSSARNVGLAIVTGDYIQFLDSDDFISKEKLALSLKLFQINGNSEIKVIISNFRMFINDTAKSTEPYCNLRDVQFDLKSILYQWDELFTIPIHCGLFDAALFETFRFPESLKAKEDWVMWVSIFHKNNETIFIDEPLAFYRSNPEGMTMSKDMFPDFIKAFGFFKRILSAKQYNEFVIHLITKFHRSDKEHKIRLEKTKKSNTYQTGLMIKKFLKSFGILKWSSDLFPILLKFKK